MKVSRIPRNKCKGQRSATVYIFTFLTWKGFVSSSNYTCICCSLCSRDRLSFATKALIHWTQFPSFHSQDIVSKVKGEFVPVNAMKTKRRRGNIYVTNRALGERKLSALTPCEVASPPPPYPLNKSLYGPQNRSGRFVAKKTTCRCR